MHRDLGILFIASIVRGFAPFYFRDEFMLTSHAFQLRYQIFPLGSEGCELSTQILGQRGESLSFSSRDVNAELFLSVRDRSFNARYFFFKERATFFHLLLLDGIQAMGFFFLRSTVRGFEASFDDDGVAG